MDEMRLLKVIIISLSLTMAGCTNRAKSPDLRELNRVETLWENPNRIGVVALYERPIALSKNQEFIVCESGNTKIIVRGVPSDAFAFVDGDTLRIYDTAKRAMAGWYKITRSHDLNWWQRTFGNQPIGEIENAKSPEKFEMPRTNTLYGGVFLIKDGKLSRIVDEEHLQELWDIPAEGLIYVAPPGIGVRYASHLPSVCP